MMTTTQLGDLNRWKRLRIAGTPLYKGLLMTFSRLVLALDTLLLGKKGYVDSIHALDDARNMYY